jgi:peptide/nickel transport system substrate-binding protein
MLEPLWTIEPARGEVINSLAAEGPIYNEDFTQMTVKLRKECYWSDGVEITADDIVYGVETAMKYQGMGSHETFNMYIDKVYKTDDYTVVFELKEPNARFHANFLNKWGAWRPFPKHVFEKVEDPLSFDFNPPVSSGPYVLNMILQVTGHFGKKGKIRIEPQQECCMVNHNQNTYYSITMEKKLIK